MTDLRKAAQALIEIMEYEGSAALDFDEYTALREALAQPEPPISTKVRITFEVVE